MTPEQALRIIDQERLDVLGEGMSPADCDEIAAYVLASEYRKLLVERSKYVNGDSKDAERYRFLKAKRGNIVEIAWNSFYSDIYSTAKMGNVDAAIDKAMLESQFISPHSTKEKS